MRAKGTSDELRGLRGIASGLAGMNLGDAAGLATKRAFDFLGAVTAVVVCSPILGGIAAWILVESGAPVFYRGVRTGRNGVSFRIWKFRTMVADAERLGGPSTGLNDPRVTASGRTLRRFKLDELPQFFNVLVGDMSFVGPRPEVPQYTAEYDDEELEILSVRPGITDYASIEFADLAEVLGSTAPDFEYEENVRPIKNRLRLKYVRERTLLIDAKILLKTLAILTIGRVRGSRFQPPGKP